MALKDDWDNEEDVERTSDLEAEWDRDVHLARTAKLCGNCNDTLLMYRREGEDVLFCTNCDYYLHTSNGKLMTYNKGGIYKKVH